jgi:uncharacterized protein YbjT (DUF2867 family)
MILVTGATGGVGRCVVDELLDAGQEIRALTRDPAAARLPDGVEVAHTRDLPMDGISMVFLNPVLFWGSDPEAFLARAKEHGVRRIVLLSSSATLGGETGNPIGVHHLKLERRIEASGLEWTFVRPGAFASNALQWARQIRAEGVVRAPYGQAQVAPIHERDIATVAARALVTDDHLGAKPVLSGPESLTTTEQVRTLGEAIGRPIRFEELTPEAAREAMLTGHMTEEIADSLLRTFASAVGHPAKISSEVERITGSPGRTFAQWAAEHTTDFK